MNNDLNLDKDEYAYWFIVIMTFISNGSPKNSNELYMFETAKKKCNITILPTQSQE